VIFPEIIGHERARTALARILRSDRIPHALLLHGPEGVGKGSVARRLAACLLCEAPSEGAGCGACDACRKAAHGNHPDLILVTRLTKRGRGRDERTDEGDADEADAAEAAAGKGDWRPFIVVAQIREMIEHASYAPREARRRVVLVDPADRMNAESQNALLKTLEEPPGRTVVLLVASRPHLLLTTVRSRCFHVGFGAMAPAALADALASRGMPQDEALARAALSEGRPGSALSLDLLSRTARRDALLDTLERLASSPSAAADLPASTATIVGEDEAEFLLGLDLVAALLRDAARIAAGAGGILHVDASRRLDSLARRLGAERATDLVTLVDRLRGDLRLNLNKTLVAETLLAAVATTMGAATLFHP
jgi:DNA polymerase III subunit delta'